jgi:hypothetical protein
VSPANLYGSSFAFGNIPDRRHAHPRRKGVEGRCPQEMTPDPITDSIGCNGMNCVGCLGA